MAKLEGVKILDAVNGEVFKVEYDGEVYARVTDGKAQEGDIATLTEGRWVIGGEVGEFYKVYVASNGVVVMDTTHEGIIDRVVEDGHGYIFRKQSPKTSSTSTPKLQAYAQTDEPQVGGYVVFDANGLDITAGKHYEITRIDQDGDPIFKDDTGDDRWRANIHSRKYYAKVGEPNGIYMVTSEDNAEQSQQPLFAKVNRPNNVPIDGDYVVFTEINGYVDYVRDDKRYKVYTDEYGDLSFTDDDGDSMDVNDVDGDWAIDNIYVKYSQEQAEQKAKIGDKILIVNPKYTTTMIGYEEGDLFTVTEDLGVSVETDVKTPTREDNLRFWSEEYIVLTPQQYGETQAEVESEDDKVSPTFNVGDYVIASPEDEHNNPYRITVPEAGAMVVSRISHPGIIGVTLLKAFKEGDIGDTFDVQTDFFRKATEAEIAKALGIDDVQVGDKVEVLAEDHFVLNKGEVVTVDEIEEDDNGDWSVTVRGWIALYAFLHGKPRFKVVEKAEEKDGELEVGDYAKFIKVDEGAGGVNVGDVVKLIGVGSAFDFRFERVRDGHKSLTNKRFLTKISDEEATETEPEFNEGDIVVITANSNYSRNKVGDIGVFSPEVGGFPPTVDVPERPEKFNTYGNYTLYAEMRHATPEEAAEYRREQAQAELNPEAEIEYAVEKGDLVQVVESPNALPEGSFFIVKDIDRDGDIVSEQDYAPGKYYYAPHHVKLIAKAADVYV